MVIPASKLTKRALAGILLLAAVSACSGGATKPPYPGIKIGRPYEVYGRWYEPKYDAHYDETGMASWYGPGFHGGHTASGERFDQNDLTAAHRTLPLPSIVKVTNLDNGRCALIKINDRGPFSHDRILDLSRGAAIRLGVWRSGTARVRVQFLDAQTRQYVADSQTSIEYAMNRLAAVDPNEAGAREEAGSQPQLQIESRMFADNYAPASPGTVLSPPPAPQEQPPSFTPAPTLTTVPADPLPPPVGMQHEPPAMPETPVTQDVPSAASIAVPLPDTFAVIDNAPEVAPDAPYQPAPAPDQPFVAPAAPSASEARPQAGGAHGFIIQAGTFGVEDNARKLAGRAASAGGARVSEVSIAGRTMYRVVLGPYNALDEAKNMLSKLAALGIPDARISRD